MTYSYKKIEEVREDVIGLKVIDFLEDGKVLFFEDEEGRNYSIDFTGNDGAVVYRGNTLEEELWTTKETLNLLLEKLDIDIDELWKL